LRCAGRKPSRLSAMLKTLCLVASRSSLPNSEGLAAEISLTDRLTASRCWVNVLVHHRDRTRLPVCLATVSRQRTPGQARQHGLRLRCSLLMLLAHRSLAKICCAAVLSVSCCHAFTVITSWSLREFAKEQLARIREVLRNEVTAARFDWRSTLTES